MARTNKNSKAATQKVSNQQQALELRRAGFGYQAIADAIGCSLGSAHAYVKDAMAETRAHIDVDAAELKAEEVSRLDGMLAGLWTSAKKGDVYAIDRVLKIMERRSRLLGLDAPARIGHGGDPSAPPIGHKLDMQSLSDTELERIINDGVASRSGCA